MSFSFCSVLSCPVLFYTVNVNVFDDVRVKKSLPEKFRNKAEASIMTAFMAATIATLTCYPLDTIRRQMQMRGTPYKNILDTCSGIIFFLQDYIFC